MTSPATDDSEASRMARRIAACRVCRDAPLKGEADRLPHEPRPIGVISGTAPILIASQAPGNRAHISGIPFNDPSGDRLRQWLGVSRDQFYDPNLFAIAPMGFCFPGYDRHGGDLPPRRECAPIWRDAALGVMPQVALVLVIGQYAQAWHLGTRRAKTLTETVRDWRNHLGVNEGPATLPLPHPSWRNTAWLKRHPWFETDLLPVLQARVRQLIA